MNANSDAEERWEESTGAESEDRSGSLPPPHELREIETTLTHLREAIGVEHTAHLIDVFLRNSLAQVEEVLDAVGRKHAPDLKRTAHQLKGSCSQVGASRLTAYCGRLEDAGESGQWQGIDALVESLTQDYRRVCNLLTHFKGSS